MSEFDDHDDLDNLLGPLGSAPRPAELSHERAVVELMVHAHHTTEGTNMFRSRSVRVATLVAAGVLGFGGMAAAGSPDANEFLAEVISSIDDAAPTTQPPDTGPPGVTRCRATFRRANRRGTAGREW